MRKVSLPFIDNRYWLAIFLASVLGTTFGDFISSELDLGFVCGLVPLFIVFAAILLVGRYSDSGSVGLYWGAVVVSRTAATNIGDLATHRLGWSYIYVAGALMFALFAVLLVSRHRRLQNVVDTRYWLALLLVSVLGTVSGDFVSDGLSLGAGMGSGILCCSLLLWLFLQKTLRIGTFIFYWLTLVLVRTAGTTSGDFLSSADGLNLGFGPSTALTAATLLLVLHSTPKVHVSLNRGAENAQRILL
jgi:uncharacterized membrane-anchored protein